ncbi:hypothetical protein SAMN04488002_0200 [Litoreibacter janthinus]|uniref:Uncharacterized protein n=1 Tax=Litoreibacter janthinus TaxID=670154 RepID=A0A1I6FSA2_9RHOB|nr:hypothetical protein SAMN04488002_0200 [Litoreibacter janthinus]
MARNQSPKWKLFPYGAFGAVLPSVVSIAGKTDWFTFPTNTQWLVAGLIYLFAAAFLATIFPYGRRSTPFNATLVGILFPSIVGGASSIAARTLPEGIFEATRSGATENIPSWMIWLEAFSLF